MKKRYRRPKLQSQEIKLQKGKVDGCVDMCIFYGDDVPGCDRALIIYYLCSNNINYKGGEIKSLLEELELRGYDLDTLRFSIRKKESKTI